MEIRGKNEFNHLILKYDDEKMKYVDITKDVFYLRKDIRSYYIGFSYNSKYYNFPLDRIIVSTEPTKILFNRNNIYINKRRRVDVNSIIKFENYGYKIFLSDYKTIFVDKIKRSGDRIDIELFDLFIKQTGNNVFDYYKTLAKYASQITLDDTSIESILFKLYNKIDKVNKQSVLSYYTGSLQRELFAPKKINVIYPFSTNYSQMNAINNTFMNQLSVISGPPGTGKTQVILNIIANAVINNMSIAVISNNNTAVENVYDKMKENGFDFLLAYLGNNENVEKFFSAKDDFKNRINEIEIVVCDESVDNISKKIKQLYEMTNKQTILKQRIYELQEELDHFIEQHEFVDFSSSFSGYSDYKKYLYLKYDLLSFKNIGLFQKLKLKIKYKLNYKIINSLNSFIIYLERKYLEEKIAHLQKEYDKNKTVIDNNDFGVLNNKLKNLSIDTFKKYIKNKYIHKDYYDFTKDNYRDKFSDFIDRYPVVLSTTHSLLRNIGNDHMFDLIVIDEASQSDILTSILAMNVAKQMVVVGDSKQLSQIDNQEIYEMSDNLATHYRIDNCYKYKDNSILHSIMSLPHKVQNTILREHYRCDARIIEFCNKKFYDNDLIICTKTSDKDPLFVIHTVEGNHARKNPNGSGQYNDRECQEIIEIIKKCNSHDIGIITPFRAQADYISLMIKNDYPFVEVDTIHKYQGRQKEIIILSTVVNDLKVEEDDFVTDFVTNSKLLNVAISRAVKNLYIVVSNNVYQSKNNTISQLIDYIRYYCGENSLEKGNVTSIFDQLYSDQNVVMTKSKCAKYCDSFAEEIMLNELNIILQDYKDYKIQMHYRLSDLIKSFDGFSREEIRYATHPKTHVDFVIFDRISYKPVLCIEVDGTRFHDYAPVQIEHDEIKNRILAANGISLLRLKTNQSDEIKKIKEYL